MLKEFKAFIMRGNVLDMAVGIIIGIAFGAVVTSLVADVIMPPIGLALGKVDFSSLYINISGVDYESLAAAREAGAPVIAYGAFINAVINFLIVALVVFLLVKAVNRMMAMSKAKKEEAAPAPAVKDCPFCASSIPIKAVRCPQCTSDLKA
jgi:large conductance mechanosensitive channel